VAYEAMIVMIIRIIGCASSVSSNYIASNCFTTNNVSSLCVILVSDRNALLMFRGQTTPLKYELGLLS